MNDPYTDTSRCIARLIKEYKKHPRLIIAVDFDDTSFPFHGEDHTYERVFKLLGQCQANDFYIVIFTASVPERFDMMRIYFKNKGVLVHGINENPITLPFGNWGKMYFNHLLDDRAGLRQSCEILEGFFEQIKRA